MISIKELQEILGVSRHTIYNYRKRGLLPCHKYSTRKIMFSKSDIEDFLRQRRVIEGVGEDNEVAK